MWSLLFDNMKELLGAPSKVEARDIDGLKMAIEERYSELNESSSFSRLAMQGTYILVHTTHKRVTERTFEN